MPNDPIALIQSKTFWSAAVALGSIIWGLTGHDTKSIDQASLVDQIMHYVPIMGEIGGVLATMVFRTTATAPIAGILKPR